MFLILLISRPSVTKSLVFIRAYSYIRVFEEKYSYFTRIFVIYSYFCDIGHILRVVSCSIQLNHMATILQSWNNQKTCCWILNCIGVLWTCIKKMCWLTHFCHKNVASRIYALFKNKNFNFTRIFTRILLVFLLKKYSYFARIFKEMSSYEEFVTLLFFIFFGF